MLRSRVCWQLLLGWALLLGQPVFGDPDGAEDPPLAESEEPVPTAQEPEESMPESQESEEPAPELQEPEEPVPGESVDPMGRPLTFEEIQALFGPSDEELETRAEESRQRLERTRDDPFSFLIPHFKRMALQHYNRNSKYFYMPYENGNVKVKKAIGTMIYIKLLLVRTGCTKEEGETLLRRQFDDAYIPLRTDKKHCEVPPESEQEIQECTFTFFRDARNKHWPRQVVTHHGCVLFGERHENSD